MKSHPKKLSVNVIHWSERAPAQREARENMLMFVFATKTTTAEQTFFRLDYICKKFFIQNGM